MSALNLMQGQIDLVKLARWSAEQRISDPDRALHCLMYGSFGASSVPKPFLAKVHGSGQSAAGVVLGYTTLTAEELQQTARETQTVAMEAVMAPEAIRTTATPDHWETGTQFRFSVRVFPTERGRWYKGDKRSERDIYQPDKVGEISRAQLYCEWVAERLRQQGGAVPLEDTLAMTSYATRRIRRQRTATFFTATEATISGALAVIDPEGFSRLLATGIGRHRAYGYGMILLNRAE